MGDFTGNVDGRTDDSVSDKLRCFPAGEAKLLNRFWEKCENMHFNGVQNCMDDKWHAIEAVCKKKKKLWNSFWEIEI